MTPEEYYHSVTDHYGQMLKGIKRKRNLVTFSKLLIFAGMVWMIYLLVTGSTLPLAGMGIVLVALFVMLTIIDTKIVHQQQKTEKGIAVSRIELEYLLGDFSHLPDGAEFQNSAHAYANDLDLFGENSLFQHLNRTVTANGRTKLISWLLYPSKNRETIQQRQQTAAELSSLSDWCREFRTLGILYKTDGSDIQNIDLWTKEVPFFKNGLIARILIYVANTITVAGWLMVVAEIIPYSLAVVFSLFQLFVLAFYLKRINRQHRQLEHFIQSIGNYFYLVRALYGQSFHSSGMTAIREKLFNTENNSLRAFASLNRILSGFDQRGNILLAFILNGLYMRDFYFIMRMDKWKEQYGKEVKSWIDTISETDVLVSMATYRFNHPSYTVPVISESVLLEARAAGHPLMKGKLNVTNDFNIGSLHNLCIVTGANMAGKSTFLRTIGVNLVLAHSGNVVCCEYFAFQPMALFTSMRTTDNLSKGTSYFHAELLRLKELVATASQEERLFIILDEMLKGTNSLDKLNGSMAFLRKLLTLPVSGLIATHDLALGELSAEFPSHFFNVCFEITHTDADITYDYKLHPGLSQNMNASILLKQMGLI